jgi:hypothetical protein
VRAFYNLEEVWGGKSVRMSKPAPEAPRKRPAKKKKKAARAKASRPRRKR